MVNWSLICMDKRSEGLGIRRLSILNKALVGKCPWTFSCESDFLWKRVILGKYEEEEGGWCSRRVRKGYEMRV